MNRRSAVQALEAYKSDSREQLFNSHGELNAGSKKEVLLTLASIMERVQSGELTFDKAAPVNENKKSPAFKKERFDNFVKAYKEAGVSGAWTDIGASMSGTLQTTMERAGFMRNFLIRGDLGPGDVPKFRRKDRSSVLAVISTDNGSVAPRYVTDPILEGFEFLISENVRVFNREINRGNVDLVEDVYLRAQQGISVREDQHYISYVRQAASLSGQVRLTSTGVTPQLLGMMRADLDSNALPPAAMIIGTQVWSDFLTPGFAASINPVHNYELIATGRLGKILDMDIITDGLRPIGLQVLHPNETVIIAAPEFHGGYTDRGPLTASPRDNFDVGEPAKGWYMFEEISVIIANAASVSLLIRQ